MRVTADWSTSPFRVSGTPVKIAHNPHDITALKEYRSCPFLPSPITAFFRPRPEPPFTIPPQHLRWRDFDYLLNAPTFDYAFAVVRDPYARLESEYYWSHRNTDKTGDPWNDFNSWAERQLERVRENPMHAGNHFAPQVSFLANRRRHGQPHRAYRRQDRDCSAKKPTPPPCPIHRRSSHHMVRRRRKTGAGLLCRRFRAAWV